MRYRNIGFATTSSYSGMYSNTEVDFRRRVGSWPAPLLPISPLNIDYLVVAGGGSGGGNGGGGAGGYLEFTSQAVIAATVYTVTVGAGGTGAGAGGQAGGSGSNSVFSTTT